MEPTTEQIQAAYTRQKSGYSSPDLQAWVQQQEQKEASQTTVALGINTDLLLETEADLKKWIEVKKANLEAIVMVENTYTLKSSVNGSMLTCFAGDALLLYRLFSQQLWMLCRNSINSRIPRISEIAVNRFMALEIAKALEEYGIGMEVFEGKDDN